MYGYFATAGSPRIRIFRRFYVTIRTDYTGPFTKTTSFPSSKRRQGSTGLLTAYFRVLVAFVLAIFFVIALPMERYAVSVFALEFVFRTRDVRHTCKNRTADYIVRGTRGWDGYSGSAHA